MDYFDEIPSECAHCGSEADMVPIYIGEGSDPDDWEIHCSRCTVRTGRGSGADVLAQWNRRQYL